MSLRGVGSIAVVLVIFICSNKAEDKLDFVMIGDWGGQPSAPYYTTAEADIADQMGKKATEVGAQFTVALGDNFYDTGVKNVDDLRFTETFEVRRFRMLDIVKGVFNSKFHAFMLRMCSLMTRCSQDGM